MNDKGVNYLNINNKKAVSTKADISKQSFIQFQY